MNKKKIIKNITKFAKKELVNDFSGHDWWHTLRVRDNAILIGKNEKCNLFIIEIAALLHDIADWKFSNYENNLKKINKRLLKLSINNKDIIHINDIIKSINFKGSETSLNINTIEGKIVFDADKLDSIGAIGIARVFAFGGAKNREIYNPLIKSKKHYTFKEYKNNNSNGINHFYEKLLLIKKLMYTNTAKKIAKRRHDFMISYLDQFFSELNN